MMPAYEPDAPAYVEQEKLSDEERKKTGSWVNSSGK
jgi:hypothetical protein